MSVKKLFLEKIIKKGHPHVDLKSNTIIWDKLFNKISLEKNNKYYAIINGRFGKNGQNGQKL